MPVAKPERTNRNIIMLTVDCWRGDHVGVNGNSEVSTPNIDRMASQGMYFSDAHTSGGWTKIAMTSLFSSTRSSQYDMSVGRIHQDRPLLAKSLQDAGYETAGMTTNLVCGTPHGFDQGFDHFEDVRPSIKTSLNDRLLAIRGMKRLSNKRLFRKFMASIGLAFEPVYPTIDAEELVDHAIEWLRKPHEGPYFLWLHFMDLHWPYKSSLRNRDFAEKDEMWVDRKEWTKLRKTRGHYRPDDQRVARWDKLYKEEVQMLDCALGRLFDNLRGRDDWHNSDLILTGDHGEEFYEHGTWGHSWNQLHGEGTHVPLIVRLSGQDKASEIGRPTGHIDIAPTILDRAGVSAPDEMLGESLCKPNDELAERPVLVEMHGHGNSIGYRLAIIYQGYKYIYDGDHDACFIFDLKADPGAMSNIYKKGDTLSLQFDKMRLAHVSKNVLHHLKAGLPVIGEDTVYDLDADPKVVERLRALGYLD